MPYLQCSVSLFDDTASTNPSRRTMLGSPTIEPDLSLEFARFGRRPVGIRRARLVISENNAFSLTATTKAQRKTASGCAWKEPSRSRGRWRPGFLQFARRFVLVLAATGSFAEPPNRRSVSQISRLGERAERLESVARLLAFALQTPKATQGVLSVGTSAASPFWPRGSVASLGGSLPLSAEGRAMDAKTAWPTCRRNHRRRNGARQNDSNHRDADRSEVHKRTSACGSRSSLSPTR